MESPNDHSLEAIHRDLALANSYRLEFIKSLLFIAGALFAFSVSFRPSLVHVEFALAFWLGWIGLSCSMFGGFVQLAAWERIYASYQRYERKEADGTRYRKRMGKWKTASLIVQLAGFVVGVSALGGFTALNLENIAAPSQPSSLETEPLSTSTLVNPQLY
ncbi:hypothetical protein GGD81_001895 [Rhodobium orientis]|uniref:hypothetical protein n=1 Tax=Rhodobium orientis TaxID=34017 RepID=UPI0011B94136|nr:hypothetical protein [Rhodobium orientis]MBB4302859.1 hypothetical protein [Rhodobium orientis]